MAIKRAPLGNDTIHIGGSEFVANMGRVEEGGPPQGDVGRNYEAGRSLALGGLPIPGSPGVDELQVDPIVPATNYSSAYPVNGGETAWSGIQPSMPHEVTGFPPKEF